MDFSLESIYEKLNERGLCASKGAYARDWLNRHKSYVPMIRKRSLRPSIAALHTLFSNLEKAKVRDLAAKVYLAIEAEVELRKNKE